MKANEGFEVAFLGEFREIVPNERIVATEVYEGASEAEGAGEAPVTTVTFADVDGRTILTQVVECGTTEVRDAIIDSGMEAGMQEAMDELERVAISLR
jgi:uncharacterized protein YndB with AHSA1/START domain